MQNAIIEKVNQAQKKKRPNFRVGDRVSVSVRLKEGDKERIQIYRGIVIEKTPKSGDHAGATFTVRKISAGVGVERIFPLHSPFVEKIQVESSSIVRRSRLYYLRNLTGKKARLKEATGFEDLVVDEAAESEAKAAAMEQNPALDTTPKEEQKDASAAATEATKKS